MWSCCSRGRESEERRGRAANGINSSQQRGWEQQTPEPSHTAGAELELLPWGREKREMGEPRGIDRQPKKQRVRMKGVPRRLGRRKHRRNELFPSPEMRFPAHASPS